MSGGKVCRDMGRLQELWRVRPKKLQEAQYRTTTAATTLTYIPWLLVAIILETLLIIDTQNPPEPNSVILKMEVEIFFETSVHRRIVSPLIITHHRPSWYSTTVLLRLMNLSTFLPVNCDRFYMRFCSDTFWHSILNKTTGFLLRPSKRNGFI